MQSPSFMVDSLISKKTTEVAQNAEKDAEHSHGDRKSAFSSQLPKREFSTTVCNCQPCQQPLPGFTAISQHVSSPPRFMTLQSMAGVSVPTPVYLPKSKSACQCCSIQYFYPHKLCAIHF